MLNEINNINCIGGITGDIIGSVYERDRDKPPMDFPLFQKYSHFTDDTVLTVALADSILKEISYRETIIKYVNQYPMAGYGAGFINWIRTDSKTPYNSWGNGSAMRVSPVGWAYNKLDEVLKKAKESAKITHNHPEGIKGAQAVAAAIFLAKNKESKKYIKNYIQSNFDYNLKLNLRKLRSEYEFDPSCQGTVPQAIFTFLLSDNFEDSIRKAVYIGGDSDTIACINGSIAEALYGGVPETIKKKVWEILDPKLRKVIIDFNKLIK